MLGLDVLKTIAGRGLSEIVNLDKICMQGYVDDVVNSEVDFNVSGSIAGKSISYVVKSKIEKDLWRNLADQIVDSTFPNATSFGQTIESVKEMIGEAEDQKTDLLKDLKEKIYTNDINDASKKDVVSSEEDFKRFAYSELPRYTLGNDGIIKLFSTESPWVLIERNDPLESAFISNGTRRMIQSKAKEENNPKKSKGK